MHRGLLRALVLALLLVAPGCRDDDLERPLNFVLFVLDTTRADAISANGVYSGTTPAVDALAAEGLRYTRAFAQSPWTLPSHASMFTGVLPSEHGAGWSGVHARDEVATLAEKLRDAGYETFGVSENPWVSESFNLHRGFRQLLSVRSAKGHGVIDAVTQWLDERQREPFFLFVNVIDSHWPYLVRRDSLPDGLSVARARRVPQSPGLYICNREEMPRRMRILRQLYHGDVAAADAKLGAVMEALKQRNADERTVTLVVSDHGELFGENRLVGHQFSVHNALLHVPLIVHGLPGSAPGVIDQPVALVDLMPSILAWAGLDAPKATLGRPLPTSGESPTEPRDIRVEYADPTELVIDSYTARSMIEPVKEMREKCDDEDRVFGSMRSVIRYPFKLVEYEGHPLELYDLERDPREEHDLAAQHGDRVSELAARLGPLPDVIPVAPTSEVDDETLDALEALGYIGE